MTHTPEFPSQLQGIDKWKNIALKSNLIPDNSVEYIQSMEDLRRFALDQVEDIKTQAEQSSLFGMYSGEELTGEMERLEDFRFKIATGYTKVEFFRELTALDAAIDLLKEAPEDQVDKVGEYLLAVLTTIQEISREMSKLNRELGQEGNQEMER